MTTVTRWQLSQTNCFPLADTRRIPTGQYSHLSSAFAVSPMSPHCAPLLPNPCTPRSIPSRTLVTIPAYPESCRRGLHSLAHLGRGFQSATLPAVSQNTRKTASAVRPTRFKPPARATSFSRRHHCPAGGQLMYTPRSLHSRANRATSQVVSQHALPPYSPLSEKSLVHCIQPVCESSSDSDGR